MLDSFEKIFALETEYKQKIIQKISGISPNFSKPSKKLPATHVIDSPIIGNGDVGVTINGPPNKQRIWISKNDFWKTQPIYKNGGPCLIGCLDMVCSDLKNASYSVQQKLFTGELEGLFKSKDKELKSKIWVAADENLLVLQLTAIDCFLKLKLNLWSSSENKAEVEQGIEQNVTWIERKFNDKDFEWPSEAIIGMCIINSLESNFQNGILTLGPNRPVTIILIIKTNHESNHYHSDAIKQIQSHTIDSVQKLYDNHKNWWKNFWLKSYLDIGDKYLEDHYYGALYLMACCSRNLEFPPGLFGNWITADLPEWAGDYHLNYNFESPYWSLYAANRIELTDPYDQPLLDYIQAGKRNAQEFLDSPGIYYDVGIGPKGFCSSLRQNPNEEGGRMFFGQKSNALFATSNMFMRYYHTLDQDYARKIYPYLIEVANFWENYLQMENGQYVSNNDCFIERTPGRGKTYETMPMDKNPLITMGMLRMFFKGLIYISDDLGINTDRRDKWQNILTNLAPLPTTKKGGLYRLCGSLEGPSERLFGENVARLIIQGTLWPAGIVGKDLKPEIFSLLQEDIKTWSNRMWMKDGNNFDTIYIGAARLNYEPNKILNYLKKRIKKNAFPNLWIKQWGGGIETCTGIIGGLNEMVFQSYEGILRIFPTWPQNKNASFWNLRAVGAFLVSSNYQNGAIKYVMIKSEKGTPIRLENPWKNNSVKIYRNKGKPHKFDVLGGDILEFELPKDKACLLVENIISGD